MSKASIIGADNTRFGAFVETNRGTGNIRDTKSFHNLPEEAGKGTFTGPS